MSTSRSLNKVMLIGNLTRDPNSKETDSGSLVVTFGLATNTSWKDSNGKIQERTEFHNIVVWNKLAEICEQLLRVGMSVFIEGELRTRKWVDKDGVTHFKTEVKAYDMKLLDNKNKKTSYTVSSSDEDFSEDEIEISDSENDSKPVDRKSELADEFEAVEDSKSSNLRKSKSDEIDVSADDLF